MTQSTDCALVTALRDFFMVHDRSELRAAYLALAQAAPQPAPRGLAWNDQQEPIAKQQFRGDRSW